VEASTENCGSISRQDDLLLNSRREKSADVRQVALAERRRILKQGQTTADQSSSRITRSTIKLSPSPV
jgi:hypothetical protein